MKQLLSFIMIALVSSMAYGQYGLETEHAIRISNTASADSGAIKFDGNSFLGYDGADWLQMHTPWVEDGLSIYYPHVSVGIAVDDPQSRLHLANGDIRINDEGALLWSEGTDTKAFLYYNGLNLNLVNNETDGDINVNADQVLSLAGDNGASLLELESGLARFRASSYSGARLDMETSTGISRIRFTAGGSVLDPVMTMRNTSNNVSLTLDGGVYDGGQIRLGAQDGTHRVIVSATTSTGGSQMLMYDDAGRATAIIDGDDNNTGGRITLEDENSNQRLFLDAKGGPNEGANIFMRDNTGTTTVRLEATEDGVATGNGAYLELYDDDGTLGIDLDADDNDNGGIINIFSSEGGSAILLEAEEGATDGAQITLRKANGDASIRIDAEFGPNGPGRITTDELEITGGSDFAEHFDVHADMDIRPGMVVSIDPRHPGQLMVCDRAHDRRVAGIISGANGVNPGMLMSHQGTIASGNYPVALTGRVYVYASQENGRIRPGDLLTTSSRAGYAMKASKRGKSEGAIIGKAMTAIDEQGFVLVLVNLQ